MKRSDVPVFSQLESRLLLSAHGAGTGTSGDTFGNTFATATSETLSSAGSLSLPGKVDFVGDADVLSVVATANGTMTVTMSDTAGKNNLRGVLYIYDSADSQLAANLNTGAAKSISVTFNVTSGSRYYVWMAGENSSVGAYTCAMSTTAAPAPIVPPLSPTGLAATDYSATQINLVWAPDSSNQTGFKVYESSDGTNYSLCGTINTPSATTYSATGLVAGVQYWFEVTAFNSGGESATSNAASATTPVPTPPPSAPSGLAATAYSGTQINLAWALDPSNQTGFKVYESSDGTNYSLCGTLNTTGATSYSATGLTAGAQYWFKVTAINSTGESASSNVANATTPTPPPPPPTGGFLPGANDYSAGAAITTQVLSTANGLVLVVIGTNGADSITLSQSATQMTMVTSAGTQTFDGAFAGVAVYGGGGNDTIHITYSVTAATVVYEGDGTDQVFVAGTGAGTVDVGAGNDLIVTVGGGADVINGGTGLDSFWVDSADTINNVTAAEKTYNVHKITAFYQPVPSIPGDAVSLQIAGQSIVEPVAGTGYADFSAQPLFVNGPQYNDIVQGQVGDCYFLSALSSLAQTHPNIIQQMIAPMGDGTYAVRFYQNGQEAYVRVDSQLPVFGQGLIYAHLAPTALTGVPLVEKAYAQFRTGQNSYASLNYGDIAATYTQLTPAGAAETVVSSYSTDDALAQYILSNLQAGHAVGAASMPAATSPIVGSHAYAIQSVQDVGGTWYVTVYNPWGKDGTAWDSNPSDGVLTITLDMFRQDFGAVDVCNA